MGNCGSAQSDPAADARSREIDRALKEEAKRVDESLKLLLRGSGESGKSTVLKQFKLIHGVGFTDQDRTSFRPAILGNVMQCAKALVNAMDTLKIPYGFEPPPPPPEGSEPPAEEAPATTDKDKDEPTSSTTSSEIDLLSPLGFPGKPGAGNPFAKNNTITVSTSDGQVTKAMDKIAMQAAAIYNSKGGEHGQQGPVVDAAEIIKAAPPSFGEGENVPDDVVAAIETVWKDPGVQYCFTRSNEYQLMDSAPYYLNDVARFCKPDFIPNDQDILSARVMTTTITETKFKVEGSIFRIFDVGGQRSERKKWAPYFDDVSAIIFLSAISAYDQTCFEDNSTNRMIESLNLFSSICNHPMFKSTSMILFLNKIDLFKKKLQTILVKSYFPSYTGPNAYEPASEFFASRFMALNKYPEKKIYVHFTWATDTKQIRTVLVTVNTIILRLNLQEAGL
ncbi:guanine nucleotide-binding protein subunit alpha [Blyttiomyces sp. JEL0837]|nr:guanine nucleotide-binding protein subunit alpha [Blyttiomyces sp. JEL0837]